jgi:hypothetical protein
VGEWVCYVLFLAHSHRMRPTYEASPKECIIRYERGFQSPTLDP